jgi:hypothetical protein
MSSGYCLLTGKYTTLAALTKGKKRRLHDVGRGRTRCTDCNSWDLVMESDGCFRRCQKCFDQRAAIAKKKMTLMLAARHPDTIRRSLISK